MAQERPYRMRWLKALGVLLGLALVVLCCVQSVYLAQELALLQLLRPAPFLAPQACTHETPGAAATPLQESLVVAVSTFRMSGRGMGARTASSVTLCITRASDGALMRHYTLDKENSYANVQDLTQVDGMIYFRLQLGPDQDTQVCAMRASDGTRWWCQANPIASSPVAFGWMPLIISEETLYIQELTRIAAVRASDGAKLWQRAIDPKDQNRSGIAVANESVYVPSIDVPALGSRQVCALRTADGTPRWCTPLDALPGIAKLVADSTEVYVLGHGVNATEAEIVALSPSDGAIQWRRTLQITGGSAGTDTYGTVMDDSFTVHNGLLYLSATDPVSTARHTALRTSDGTTRWELATDQLPTFIVHGDVVYAATNSASLQALHASDGEPVWKRSIEGVTRMVVGGERLYVLDHESNLYAIGTSDGQLLWEHTTCFSTAATEPHIENGATVWCSWGTDGIDITTITPFALAAEP